MQKTIHTPMPPELLRLVAARFKVMAEPVRLSILQALQAGEMSVSDLCKVVQASQPNVSKHLRILQEAGFLARRQDGNTVHYAIADDTIFAICELVCSSLRERFSAQAAVFSDVN